MNTPSLTKNNAFLKRLEFLKAHVYGTFMPLQEDKSSDDELLHGSVALVAERPNHLVP
jgi:hypothetical protein